MARVGLQVDKDYLNAKSGSIATMLDQVLRNIDGLQRGIAGLDAAGLAAEFGFTTDEATSFLFAVTALVKVRDLTQGTDTLPTPINLLTYIHALTGID